MVRHYLITQKRVQGWCDSPLTENGICQAEQAKQYFAKKGISFDAVYSSTQERATDTAKIVAPEYTVTQLKGIKEMNLGLLKLQPEHLLPKHRPGSRSFEDLLVPYGGEDIRKVGQRVFKDCFRKKQKNTLKMVLRISYLSVMGRLYGD